ncbi:hypothetical protein Tco_0044374 [Tanacetum coccineum]
MRPTRALYETLAGPSTAIAAQPQVIDDLYREMDNLRERQGALTKTMWEVSDIEATKAARGEHLVTTELASASSDLVQPDSWDHNKCTKLPLPKLVSDERGRKLCAADSATRKTRQVLERYWQRGRSKVKFAAATLQGRALTWWNTQVATLGLAEATGNLGYDMKKIMLEEFCPKEEISRMEDEL